MLMKFVWIPVLGLVVLAAGCIRAHYEDTEATPPATAATYHNPYNMPFTSAGTKFAGLPPAVQNSIRAQAGAADLYDVTKLTNGTQVAYQVLFRNPGIYPPLYIAPDGSVLNPDFTVAKSAPADTSVFGAFVAGVSISDLPAPVLKTIQKRAPTTEVDYIDKESRGDQVVFVVTFKDKVHYPRLYITSDGTILKEALQ